MQEISDDEDDDAHLLLDNATARDSLALQAYLRERKISQATKSSPARGSASPFLDGRMDLQELDNTLTVVSPGLRVRTNFSSVSRGSPPKTSAATPSRQASPSKRFDEGGGVYIEDSTRSLRSMVKKSYEEKKQYQQALHEKQLEIESLKKSFLEMTTRCERLNMMMNRSKKVLLPNKVSFLLEKWSTRCLYGAFHRWTNAVSDYSTDAMRTKEDLMNRERQDWLTIRRQWGRKQTEMSSALLVKSINNIVIHKLAKAFRKWFANVKIDVATTLVQEVWIGPINEKSRVKMMFSRWKAHWVVKRGARKLLLKIMSRMLFRHVMVAFNKWRQNNRVFDAQKSILFSAMSIINKSSPYARCLEKWRHFAFITQPRRLQLHRILSATMRQKCRLETKQYFDSWRIKSKSLNMIPARLSIGIKRSATILTRNFFQRWSHSSRKRSKLVLAMAAVSRCASESRLDKMQRYLTRWYRTSTTSHIEDLQNELHRCREELISCHETIRSLHGDLETVQLNRRLREESQAESIKHSSVKRMVLRCSRGRLSLFFSLWRYTSRRMTEAINARRLKILSVTASRFISTGISCVSTAFRVWSAWSHKKKGAEKILSRFLLNMRQVVRRRAFKRWVIFVASVNSAHFAKVAAQRRVRSVLFRMLNGKLFLGWSKWKEWLQNLKDKKSGAYYIRKMLTFSNLKWGFTVWKTTCNRLIRLEIIKQNMGMEEKLKFKAVLTLKRVFSTPAAAVMLAWKEYVRSCKLARGVINRIVSSREVKMLRSGFLTWRTNTTKQVKFDQTTSIVARSFARYFRDNLSVAFASWKSFTVRHREFSQYEDRLFTLRSEIDAGVQHHHLLLKDGSDKVFASKVFQAWRQLTIFNASHRTHKIKIMRSCICRMQLRQLAKGFSKWQRDVMMAKRAHGIMRRTLSRMCNIKLSTAMKQWMRITMETAREDHISYLKHASQLHISSLEALQLISVTFKEWSAFTEACHRQRRHLRRTLKKMCNGLLMAGFNSWKSKLKISKSLMKTIRLITLSHTRSAMVLWKQQTLQFSRMNVVRRVVRRWRFGWLFSAWRQWYAVTKRHRNAKHLVARAMQLWTNSSRLRMSTAFFRLKVSTLLSGRREGYSERSHSLHLSRGNMKCLRRAYDAWKMFSSSALKSDGVPIMGTLNSTFPIISTLADILNPDVDVIKSMSHDEGSDSLPDLVPCYHELYQVSEEICAAVTNLLPEFNCSVFAFDPDMQALLSCDPNESKRQEGSPQRQVFSPSGMESHTMFRTGSNEQGFMKSAGIDSPFTPGRASVPKSAQLFTQMGGVSSAIHDVRGGLVPSFHSLADFETASESAAVNKSSPQSPRRGFQNYFAIGPSGGDVGICAASGTHIVRRALLSEALLYSMAQNRQTDNPGMGSFPRPRRSPMRSNSGLLGRSPSKMVSFTEQQQEVDEEATYVFAALVPIAWKGEVVGVLRLKSAFLSSPSMAALDLFSRSESLVGDGEKQSWLLFSKSLEAATMQVYPVCMKLGLDVERSMGLNALVQFCGWALGSVLEKDKRKKIIHQHLQLNPPGPSPRTLLTKAIEERDGLAAQLQELLKALGEGERVNEKLSEKCSKYKKYAENWKKRSEALQRELDDANDKIRYLMDKYGDVRRIHDSLQRVTEETFSRRRVGSLDDLSDEEYFDTPGTSPMRL